MNGRRPRALAGLVLALGAALLFPLAYFAESSEAQPRLDPNGVVAAVERFYGQSPVFAADFNQTYVYRVFGKTLRSRGRVAFKRPGRMRWDYSHPRRSLLVCDGTRVQHYDPEARIVAEEPATASRFGALSFLTGTGRIADQFTFSLLDGPRHGWRGGYLLSLAPRRPSPHYTNVLLFVDGRSQRLGLVWRVVVVDSEGNRDRFDFVRPTWAAEAVTDAQFVWTAPAGTQRIRGRLPGRE